jgi:hypothetical protein
MATPSELNLLQPTSGVAYPAPPENRKRSQDSEPEEGEILSYPKKLSLTLKLKRPMPLSRKKKLQEQWERVHQEEADTFLNSIIRDDNEDLHLQGINNVQPTMDHMLPEINLEAPPRQLSPPPRSPPSPPPRSPPSPSPRSPPESGFFDEEMDAEIQRIIPEVLCNTENVRQDALKPVGTPQQQPASEPSKAHQQQQASEPTESPQQQQQASEPSKLQTESSPPQPSTKSPQQQHQQQLSESSTQQQQPMVLSLPRPSASSQPPTESSQQQQHTEEPANRDLSTQTPIGNFLLRTYPESGFRPPCPEVLWLIAENPDPHEHPEITQQRVVNESNRKVTYVVELTDPAGDKSWLVTNMQNGATLNIAESHFA